jgi:hypothetical protein
MSTTGINKSCFWRVELRWRVGLDNLTDICEPIVYTVRDPPHLTVLCIFTTCYWDSFIFLNLDDVRTSRDTHLRASESCYGNSIICLQFPVDVMSMREVAGVKILCFQS